ncbi:MAG: radical SAM protein, partial [Bacteroidales bacterium]|nr:radical SAM protein [Bacteroidales bacterium]
MTPADTAPAGLVDPFGRQITYLRLSVTDRCNLRCTYCMAEDMTFLPRQRILTLEEMVDIAAAFTSLGVGKIRLTGGEPLVRQGVLALAEKLGALPGLRELTMTTNGALLPRYARGLWDAGMRRLNISLDSLDPQRFRAMTRTGELGQVLAGIDSARSVGFDIKLNAVVLAGVNDHEVCDLARFAVD